MTNYLFKILLGLAICVAALVVAYNYFWGTDEEQQSSKEIIAQVKGLTGSVADLLMSEKDKYDKGKYDDALSKIKTALSTLKEKATAMGEGGHEVLGKLSELEQQRKDLEQQLAELESEGAGVGNMMASPGIGGDAAEPSSGDRANDRDTRAEAIRQQILKLNQDAERLSQEFT